MNPEHAPALSGAFAHYGPRTVGPSPPDRSSGQGNQFFLEGAEEVLREERLVQDWLTWVTDGPSSSIYLHPGLVLAAGSQGAPPLVYVHRSGRHPGTAPLVSLAALAPKTRRVRFLPGLALGLSLHGRRVIADQILGDDGEAATAAFVRTLAGWLRSSGAGGEFVLFEDVELESPLWQALKREEAHGEVAVYYPDHSQPHWWIRFPKKAEDYWKQFSSKTRYNLRRAAEKLPHSLACFSDKDSVAGFLEKARYVSERSWQAKRLGLRIRNTPEERTLCEFLASQGALRCYLLEQDGRPLAFEVAVQWNGRFVLEETGYDSAFSQFSPGTVLLYRILQDLIASDTPRLLDFGFGNADYKRLFANYESKSGPVLLVRRSLRPLTAMHVDRMRRTISRGLRTVSTRLRILPVLRRMFRG